MKRVSAGSALPGQRQHQLVQPLARSRPDPRAGRLRPAAPGRTGCGSSRAKRALVGLVLQPLHERMVRVDLEDRLASAAPSAPPPSACARGCVLMPCSSATRQAGESVRRCVTRTSFTCSPSAFLILLDQRLELAGLLFLLLLLRLVRELAQVEVALRHRLQRLAVELGQVATPPTRRRGRTAAAPRCPSCGRSPGAGCSSPRRSCRR